MHAQYGARNAGLPPVIKPSYWTVLSFSKTWSRPELPIPEQPGRDGETREGERTDRRAAMRVLAEAKADEIERGLKAVIDPLAYAELRVAETGLVMLRGRIGGEGAPFNLGEATVTRAAVQIPSGEVGFAYILGRDHRKARLSAICDALWQSESYREIVEREVLVPIRTRVETERAHRRAQTAATRVDFFTMVRGED
jgi:alpha-D-ribose 1-methylphosphonate 5-triphosphate synthase subunit PhnG